MNTKEILAWLNGRTGSEIQSLKQAQTGYEICCFLCNLPETVGSPELRSSIKRGATFDERKENFELAKDILELLQLPFVYDIQKLAKGDRAEFVRFAIDVMSLDDGDESISDDNELDSFLDELEANLDDKMRQVEAFQAELNECARERDFYFSKLRLIENVCEPYEKDADAVIQILSVSSNDFEPVPEPEAN